MRGFSLLEMAIVLVLLGGIAVLLSTPIVRALRSETDLRAAYELEQVRDALIGYAQSRLILPDALSAAVQSMDMFGNAIAYSADSRLLFGNICDGSLSASDITELQVRTSGGDVPHVAFYLVTAGQDGQQRIDSAGSLVDVREPGDDQVLFVSWYQLRAAACSAE